VFVVFRWFDQFDRGGTRDSDCPILVLRTGFHDDVEINASNKASGGGVRSRAEMHGDGVAKSCNYECHFQR